MGYVSLFFQVFQIFYPIPMIRLRRNPATQIPVINRDTIITSHFFIEFTPRIINNKLLFIIYFKNMFNK